MVNAFDRHFSAAKCGVYKALPPGHERDTIIDALNGVVREYVSMEAKASIATLELQGRHKATECVA